MWRRRGYDYDQRDFRPRGERFEGRYPGGREGYRAEGRNGYDREMRGFDGRGRSRGPSYDRDFAPNSRRQRPYGGDYWWIGEHEFRGRGRPSAYDDAYRKFTDDHHPRFSPVGGMYPSVGGPYAKEGPPPPLREYTRFSDWTRWF